MLINPLFTIDFYKADHRRQYPTGTEYVYSNFTARKSRLQGINEVVFFGLQFFIQDYLIEAWQHGFFLREKKHVVKAYKRIMDNCLGKDAIDISHIEALHDLGYLPIDIQAFPEGFLVPIGIPLLTIVNTLPNFFWLTNYLETVLSNYLWKPITSATTAYQYKKLLTRFAEKTCDSLDFVPFQAHDFSMRGMSNVQDAIVSGAAHLTSFVGTDCVASIPFLEDYYYANSDQELVGGSVPATEHSVMCMGTQDGEFETFKRLITEIYPTGIVSIVSDTWDFWKVITEYLPRLKVEILARPGKVVIRPDSGDPRKIICGDPSAEWGTPERKGAIECLAEIFGGRLNNKGYFELNPQIGLIYGDSITLEKANEILSMMDNKNFASNNIVLGVGSYTYQYVTRDTFGFAVKATWGMVNGESRNIFKNPKTDDGTKKSAKGLLRVGNVGNKYVVFEEQDFSVPFEDCLKPVFLDGNILTAVTLNDIRERLK